ncbi:MAG: hypothetical protein KC435_05090 [Thermomicrobiales bacterium]|nr:hypothetical protein [Thermomicrobiales bacterium]
MAKSKNGTKALVVGSVLGLVAGAAYALWKTPMSGKDLRARLNPTHLVEAAGGSGIAGKAMETLEKTLAPIVGVELGKTANESTASSSETGPITVAEPTNGAAADYGTNSIRAQRYSWGAAAPEVTKTEAVAEPVVEAAAETVDTNAAELTATSADYGTASIKAKRFAWGSPAPETTTVTEPAPVVEAVAAAVAVEAVTPDAPSETAAYGTTSIRTKRSGWSSGDTATVVAETPVEKTESTSPGTAVAEAIVAEEVVTTTSGYGTDSIKARRSSWGGDAGAAAAVVAEAAVAVEEPAAEETQEIAAVVPASGMVPFPQLGGLE